MEKQINVWNFVEKYYPKYYKSQEIAENDDLAKLVDGEYEDGDHAHRLLKKEYGDDINNPKIEQDYVSSCETIYRESILAFLDTKHYYLFGQDITKEYFDGDFAEVLEMAKTDTYDFSVFAWSPSDGPGALLDAADGWMGTAEITKEEYEQLLKIKQDEKD